MQKNCCEFEASSDYVVSSRPAWVTQGGSVSKKIKINQSVNRSILDLREVCANEMNNNTQNGSI